MLCAAYESFAESCESSGVEIGFWRSTSLCPLKCQSGYSFKNGVGCQKNPVPKVIDYDPTNSDFVIGDHRQNIPGYIQLPDKNKF